MRYGGTMRGIVAVALIWLAAGLGAAAQDLSALARLDPAASSIRAEGAGIAFDLAISQPVPWRVRVLADPPRLVLDTREVDWSALDRLAPGTPRARALRAGVFRPGWSRLVMELDGPYLVASAEMATGRAPAIRLRLDPATPEAFALRAALPEPPGWALPAPADLPRAVPRGSGPLTIVLDPGHGGLDPGAERGPVNEKTLVLQFARELKDLLVRDGRFVVVLTRNEDVFVPLEARISVARAAGADLLLSLHADALAEGEAVGAVVYTLSDAANDAASQALAERHDRDDLLAGVDLTDQDDLVSGVLMDMARAETDPRTDRLAAALEAAIKAEGLTMHRQPRQQAGFSVLKSPDIPSVLLELGFLSSSVDLEKLQDAAWRAQMAEAIRQGVVSWAEQDAALSTLLRR